MARITVEDCLSNEGNRFSLVRLASRRAKQLLAGQPAVSDTKGNKAVVSALREIADGKVKFTKGSPPQEIDTASESIGETGSATEGEEVNGEIAPNGAHDEQETAGAQTTIVQSH